jgi:hypothetical protein
MLGAILWAGAAQIVNLSKTAERTFNAPHQESQAHHYTHAVSLQLLQPRITAHTCCDDWPPGIGDNTSVIPRDNRAQPQWDAPARS